MSKNGSGFEGINKWLQLAGNLGIVLGLLLVVVQLKQNADLTKTQLLYDESQRQIDLETRVVGEEGARVWARSLTEPGQLTLEEQRIVEALLWSFVEQLRAAYMLGELGLLDAGEWKTRVRGETGFFLANPYGRAWWNNFSINNEVLPAELIAAVNARLAELQENFTLDYMGSIKQALDR